jgi:hypothetical protein
VLRFCLASIICHQDFLRETLPPKHPIFSTFCFSLLTCEEKNCLGIDLESTLTPTGIPPHVYQLLYLEKLIQVPEKITESIKKMLEEREYYQTANITIGNLEKSLFDLKSEMMSEFRQLLSNNERNKSPETAVQAKNNVYWHLWKKTGRFHRLPEDFVLPKKSQLQVSWNLWFIGNHERRWTRFSDVTTKDIPLRSCQKLFSEWKIVFAFFSKSLESKNILTSQIKDVDGSVRIYNTLFKQGILVNKSKGKRTVRTCQKTIISLAKTIRKK